MRFADAYDRKVNSVLGGNGRHDQQPCNQKASRFAANAQSRKQFSTYFPFASHPVKWYNIKSLTELFSERNSLTRKLILGGVYVSEFIQQMVKAIPM